MDWAFHSGQTGPPRHNVTILAVKDSRTGQISASPAPDYVFNRDDWLIVLGTAADVEKLR